MYALNLILSANAPLSAQAVMIANMALIDHERLVRDCG